MGPTHTFRTVFARGLTGAAAVLILIVSVYSLLEGGLSTLWRSLPFLVVGGGMIWVLFGNPKVSVADGGITLVNIVRSVHVPWPTLRGVETRWSLSVETTSGNYASWAIPASSGMGVRLRNPGWRGLGKDSGATQSLNQGHNADAVSLVIAHRLEALTEAGHLEDEPVHQEVRPEVSWNTRELVVLGVCVLAVAAAVLTG